MIPGGPRNDRQMQMMMRRLGMVTEPLADVEEVVIRLKDRELVFARPEVTALTVQGVKTYQVIGDPKPRAKVAPSAGPAAPGAAGTAPPPPAGPPEEDIELVMEQASVDRAAAIEALNATDGAPAEAILRILSKRGA